MGTAILAAAGQVTGAVQSIESLIGGSHKYAASSVYVKASAARIASYNAGVIAGSTVSGQLLLGIKKTNTDNTTQANAGASIAQLAGYPAMQGATMLGPIVDSADGYQGLAQLVQLGVGFTDPYAGYNTSTGAAPSGATLALVQKLRNLPVAAATALSTPAASTPAAPSSSGSAPAAPAAPLLAGAPGGAGLVIVLLLAVTIALGRHHA